MEFNGAYGGNKDKKKKSTLQKMAEMTKKAKDKNNSSKKFLDSLKKLQKDKK